MVLHRTPGFSEDLQLLLSQILCYIQTSLQLVPLPPLIFALFTDTCTHILT